MISHSTGSLWYCLCRKIKPNIKSINCQHYCNDSKKDWIEKKKVMNCSLNLKRGFIFSANSQTMDQKVIDGHISYTFEISFRQTNRNFSQKINECILLLVLAPKKLRGDLNCVSLVVKVVKSISKTRNEGKLGLNFGHTSREKTLFPIWRPLYSERTYYTSISYVSNESIKYI